MLTQFWSWLQWRLDRFEWGHVGKPLVDYGQGDDTCFICHKRIGRASLYLTLGPLRGWIHV